MAKRDRLERRIDRVEGRMRKAQSKGKNRKLGRLSDRRDKLKGKLYSCKTNRQGRKVCSTRSRGRSGGGGPKSLLR
tara:strand:+ start:542 stop:769 length:228 start_codon:yes stop_codon:yes gene_type:complete